MTQTVDFPAAGPLDPDDAAAKIRDANASFLSMHKGAGEPGYAVEGTVWTKEVSSTLNEVYQHDGTDNIFLYSYNPTTHALLDVALAANQVTLGKLQQIATARILGRKTASTGNVESLTPTDVTGMLDVMTGDSGSGGIKGLAPAPSAGDAAANKFLKANGIWAAPPSGLDPGAIMDFAMETPPAGWLECYGQAVSRSTYSALYAAVGDVWGPGNGSTTFNLPDLRGRVRAGMDDMGGGSANRLTGQTGGVNGDTFAATGGSEVHTLTAAQMPSHTHSLTVQTGSSGSSSNPQRGFGGGGTAGSLGSAGSDEAHNNVQPTAIVLTCIKT